MLCFTPLKISQDKLFSHCQETRQKLLALRSNKVGLRQPIRTMAMIQMLHDRN